MSIIPKTCVGYEMIDTQSGAYSAESVIIVPSQTSPSKKKYFVKESQEIVLDLAYFIFDTDQETITFNLRHV